MKILQLTAENVKKLRAVEIKPTGEIVTIAGQNGQGKTSVLDSIYLALDHTAVDVAMPIRKGEKKARVRLDLGDLIVERRFTEAGSTLTVENAQGARFPSPQKMLDALLGSLSFDPLAFARMEPRKQFDELRKIVKLDIDLEQLEGLNRADYAKRADLNRDAKTKRAQAEGIKVADGLPEQVIDENEILNKITGAGDHNALITRHQEKRERDKEQIVLTREKATRAHARAEQLRAEAEACDKEEQRFLAQALEQQKSFDALEPLPDPVDVVALRSELDGARSTNRLIAFRQHRQEIEREAADIEAQAQEITERMDARARAKAEAISKAQMPIEALGFGDGIVTYKSVPFSQASSAEQLRVSLAIAMKANPKLRVIRIQDGSLLDKQSLAAIAAMAKEHDYQIWIEKVDDSGKVGIVIEDGEVIAVNEPAVA
jgi:ABC-type dipeptide/oligopeptide/nickel transport system ATPase component